MDYVTLVLRFSLQFGPRPFISGFSGSEPIQHCNHTESHYDSGGQNPRQMFISENAGSTAWHTCAYSVKTRWAAAGFGYVSFTHVTSLSATLSFGVATTAISRLQFLLTLNYKYWQHPYHALHRQTRAAEMLKEEKGIMGFKNTMQWVAYKGRSECAVGHWVRERWWRSGQGSRRGLHQVAASVTGRVPLWAEPLPARDMVISRAKAMHDPYNRVALWPSVPVLSCSLGVSPFMCPWWGIVPFIALECRSALRWHFSLA